MLHSSISRVLKAEADGETRALAKHFGTRRRDRDGRTIQSTEYLRYAQIVRSGPLSDVFIYRKGFLYYGTSLNSSE